MKEVYLTAAEAARDLGVEAPVIRFLMQKHLVKSGKVVPMDKSRQKKYIIYTRQLCAELGIPFVSDERTESK